MNPIIGHLFHWLILIKRVSLGSATILRKKYPFRTIEKRFVGTMLHLSRSFMAKLPHINPRVVLRQGISTTTKQRQEIALSMDDLQTERAEETKKKLHLQT
ncbi:MAG: hypothetical protein ACPGEC_00595, partial [Flavobacteriales bacterium]